jgi:hypothetical protein
MIHGLDLPKLVVNKILFKKKKSFYMSSMPFPTQKESLHPPCDTRRKAYPKTLPSSDLKASMVIIRL